MATKKKQPTVVQYTRQEHDEFARILARAAEQIAVRVSLLEDNTKTIAQELHDTTKHLQEILDIVKGSKLTFRVFAIILGSVTAVVSIAYYILEIIRGK